LIQLCRFNRDYFQRRRQKIIPAVLFGDAPENLVDDLSIVGVDHLVNRDKGYGAAVIDTVYGRHSVPPVDSSLSLLMMRAATERRLLQAT